MAPQKPVRRKGAIIVPSRTPALSSLLPGVVHRQISPVLRVMSTVTASAEAEAISMIATTTRTLRLSHRQIQRRQYVRACDQIATGLRECISFAQVGGGAYGGGAYPAVAQ